MQPGKLVRDLISYSVITLCCGLMGYCTVAQRVSPPGPREWLTEARTSLYSELAAQRLAHGRDGRWSPATRATRGTVRLTMAVYGSTLVLTSRHRRLRGVTCELRYAPGSRLGSIPSVPVQTMAARPSAFPIDGRPYCYRAS